MRPGVQRHSGFGAAVARSRVDVVLQLGRIVAEVLAGALRAGEQVEVAARRVRRELEQHFDRFGLRDGRVIVGGEIVSYGR